MAASMITGKWSSLRNPHVDCSLSACDFFGCVVSLHRMPTIPQSKRLHGFSHPHNLVGHSRVRSQRNKWTLDRHQLNTMCAPWSEVDSFHSADIYYAQTDFKRHSLLVLTKAIKRCLIPWKEEFVSHFLCLFFMLGVTFDAMITVW